MAEERIVRLDDVLKIVHTSITLWGSDKQRILRDLNALESIPAQQRKEVRSRGSHRK